MRTIERGDLIERAEKIAQEAAKEAYTATRGPAQQRLLRSMPIIDILQRNDISPSTKPIERGFYVVVKEGERGFFERIEATAGMSLEDGTILYPCGFDGYKARLGEARRYYDILKAAGVESKIIPLPILGSGAKMAVLFVPPIPA
ncbi:MAG: hypothetical protein ACD_81C00213G0009 [uncultured bacterium]|uniref:Uncharacterized protein n=2 Tax=Candidatus Wolfeibacteriota TaxID=1752735 RepID=A0A0G1JIP7_9BACT|nr:MAG: hypothetical protein ACD_81C00213G0009 [uncultured bacterium]KKR12928.1 MAG: hypothetical protein UT41_C0001G0472 [Candidatus Wolfebacteria bacterium GW2011_GWC2_39_22]KKT43857.1 MAG: hypothetical protein UW32_C0001G0449 [Candidatus Wolfebacteria bacterium GW2011_GWE2_44_13]